MDEHDPNFDPHLVDDFEDFGLIRGLFSWPTLISAAAVVASVLAVVWRAP